MTANDLAGHTVGQYEVRERIAEGGMAVVYRAYQPVLGREVALKVLSRALADEPGFLQRFANEARMLAKLDHPNVLPVYDFGSFGDLTYIATPLVSSGTLADRLEAGHVDVVLATSYLTQVADALHHAHAAGITHRDLKPSNILIHPDGRAILADFGLSRTSEGISLTLHGIALGTPGYMAPEQALGDIADARADIYALGVIAFELLAGSRPYTGGARTLVMNTMQTAVPSVHERNSTIPIEVDAVIASAMAKDPAQRQETVKEFIAELTRALAPLLPAPSPNELNATSPSLLVLPAQETTTLPTMITDSGSLTGQWPAVTPTPPPATPTGKGQDPAAEARPAGERPIDRLVYLGLERVEAQGRLVLNSHFAHAFHAATHLAGDRWMDLVTTSGLQYLLTDPADDGTRNTPVHELAWLNEAMEVTFGSQAAAQQRRWGGLTMQLEIERTEDFKKLHRRVRLMPAGHRRRIRELLQAWCERMDTVRGEHLQSWNEVGADEFWVAVQDNPYVFGKRKATPSCHALTGQLETLLRWVGLANQWVVTEIECGCVEGSDVCVFAVTSAGKT
jgi:serine/threonine protein kinase